MGDRNTAFLLSNFDLGTSDNGTSERCSFGLYQLLFAFEDWLNLCAVGFRPDRMKRKYRKLTQKVNVFIDGVGLDGREAQLLDLLKQARSVFGQGLE